MTRLTLFASLVVGCGGELPAPSRPSGVSGPPELRAYVDEFLAASGGRGAAVGVALAPPTAFPSQTVGLCRVDSVRGSASVVLNSDYWFAEETGDAGRWVVVMHEMGHCALGRDHADALDADGCAVSVMRWEVGAATECLKYGVRTRADYLSELINPVREPLTAPLRAPGGIQ